MAASVATPLERQFSHIAGITEMTSSSSLGSTSITLQFDLSRDIDGAARDVQAAINAARTYLPANLPSNPSYRKVNPADAPIMILGLTSDKYDVTKVYDLASTGHGAEALADRGRGPGVRRRRRNSVGPRGGRSDKTGELRPDARQRAVDAEPAEFALAPRADLRRHDDRGHHHQRPDFAGRRSTSRWSSAITTARRSACQMSPTSSNSTQNLRTAGYLDGTQAVFVIIFRQPGANIIETVDRIQCAACRSWRRFFPRASRPPSFWTAPPPSARRCSNVERTLIGSIILVVLVVFVFLRSPRATLIPSVAVPVSLIGTFAVMYLLGYSLDNLSLMALTIATGFVVDDAIVVMENITRHLESGHGAVCGGAARRQGDRVHGVLDQHVADRGVHSHSDDGRHRRTAVPRIRGDAVDGHRRLDGDFADHDADHVRAPAEDAQAGREAQLALSGAASDSSTGCSPSTGTR